MSVFQWFTDRDGERKIQTVSAFLQPQAWADPALIEVALEQGALSTEKYDLTRRETREESATQLMEMGPLRREHEAAEDNLADFELFGSASYNTSEFEVPDSVNSLTNRAMDTLRFAMACTLVRDRIGLEAMYPGE